MLSMIVVGFATNIWVAVLGRAIGGLLNGNIGVIQTMVGELVTKPEHERKCFLWKIDELEIDMNSSSILCNAICLVHWNHFGTCNWWFLCRSIITRRIFKRLFSRRNIWEIPISSAKFDMRWIAFVKYHSRLHISRGDTP